MTLYAKNTNVSVSASKQEIDKILARYRAERRGVMEEPGRALVIFEREGRRVQMEMFLPHPDGEEFKRKRSSYGREAGEFDPERHEQACRQKWRALGLVLKAKLEAVESGITTFETEFLAHIMLPGGGTVGKWFKPQLEQSYKNGKMPPLLGSGT